MSLAAAVGMFQSFEGQEGISPNAVCVCFVRGVGRRSGGQNNYDNTKKETLSRCKDRAGETKGLIKEICGLKIKELERKQEKGSVQINRCSDK